MTQAAGMRALEGSELLALWEHGAGRHALDRSALLAAAARRDWAPDSVADQPLGAVNASLLRLRSACFGPRIDGHADCPRCGQRLAFTLDTRALLADAPQQHDAAAHTDAAGLRLRAPHLRDLAAIADADDAGQAARALLARCTLAGDPQALDAAALADVEAALQALDPQAELTLALACVACGHAGTALLDAGALLWDEIAVRAQALLTEVHQLARAYGWREHEVLALSATRRAHYLALVQGEAPA